MAGDAKIIRVVVASPGDVQAERGTVPIVVNELNRGVAADRGLRLEVYRWETDAYPGLNAEGPQGLIDPILRIEDSDVLLGIFWKRFGTPAADGQTGTEHEIGLAYEAWKKNKRPQIMVYFNSEPYAPTSKKETDQWGRVLDFKDTFPKEGLWWPYHGASDFEKLLRIHLSNFIRARFPLKQAEAAATGEHLERRAPTAIALHQLPPPPRDFTGREAELKELMTAVETKGVTISGLQGLAGAGKTALALALAEMLKPRYPDAQFYLDLKGVADRRDAKAEPLTPGAVMAHVVRSYHPTAKLPESETDLSGLYQSVLHGQRALLLMDNAKNRKQVEPLIPPVSCLLLVTSRQHFTLPGLYAKELGALTPGDARDLLLKIAPRINGHGDALAKLCGYLPLALRLAASAIAEQMDLTPADYAERLTKARKRLELIEASLDLSYQLLMPEMKKLFCALAVFPDTFDAAATAAVWALEHEAARDALSRLVAQSVLEWNVANARYRLHDLVRLFADARLGLVERALARRRHAEHFVTVLEGANTLYEGGKEGVATGLELFDLEWESIRVGQAWAAASAAQDQVAARLCTRYLSGGAYLLDLRQHPRERIPILEAALAAARRWQDRMAEGGHLGNLGIAYKNLGEIHRAIECQEQALAIHRENGFRRGEANALMNLGVAYKHLADPGQAIEYYEEAMLVFREIGDRRGEGSALGNLGTAYHDLGDARRAVEYGEQALVIAREIGDRRGEGCALFNTSQALEETGDRAQAIAKAEAALKIFEQIEDPNTEVVRQQLAAWKKP